MITPRIKAIADFGSAGRPSIATVTRLLRVRYAIGEGGGHQDLRISRES